MSRLLLLALVLILAIPVALWTLPSISDSADAMIASAANQLPTSLVSSTGQEIAPTAVIGNWPPSKGEAYPDLILRDQNGEVVHLSDFAGRPILLELAAIPCAGCQAFAGANDFGSFDGVKSQGGLESIHKYAKSFANVRLGEDTNVVFIQLLLYSKSMTSPTSEDVAAWAKHFEMERTDSNLVLQGDASMLGRETYESIPGFHLIDSDFILQYDSCGHRPKDDLYRDLLPALGKMAREITPTLGKLHSNPFGS